jgi:hypothetical protein
VIGHRCVLLFRCLGVLIPGDEDGLNESRIDVR